MVRGTRKPSKVSGALATVTKRSGRRQQHGLGAAVTDNDSMKFLLTNDDGIDAPGLAALQAAAHGLGKTVTVAPAFHVSGCSHQVTTQQPLRLAVRGEARFAVEGTPADCVRVALHSLAPDVTWVLSGINAGGNLGADVYVSGTVAAVREAVLHGRPGIAVSHYIKRGLAVDWERAARWLTPLLRDLVAQSWTPGTLWNINLPHLEPGTPEPEWVLCSLDAHPLPVTFRREGDLLHYEGNYHLRSRAQGADVDICFQGKIAVTKLSLV
jgi:5'-nucleotidase